MAEKKTKEFFRVLMFTVVSVSAALVQMGSFALFNEAFGWSYWAAYLTSLLLSVLWNFTVNRKVTFKSANNVPVAMLLVLLFYAVFTPVSTILGNLADERGVNEYIVLIVTMLANFVLEFLYTRYVVYRGSCDTAEQQPKSPDRKPVLYKILYAIVRLFYRKREFVGELPDEPSVIVANHAQIHGPLIAQLYYPRKKRIWCDERVMSVKSFAKYAYEDFWAGKPKWCRWFFWLCSRLLAPLGAFVFKHSDTIAVYRDSRLIGTLRETAEALKNGYDIIIFPEQREAYNEIVNGLQPHFTAISGVYYAKTGKEVAFVPLYNAPRIRNAALGSPLHFNRALSRSEAERELVDEIKQQITRLAKELPPHTVLPYDNVGRKNYPKSR